MTEALLKFLLDTDLQTNISGLFHVSEFFILAAATIAFWKTRKIDRLQGAILLTFLAFSLDRLWSVSITQLRDLYPYMILLRNYITHISVMASLVYVIVQLRKAKRKEGK